MIRRQAWTSERLFANTKMFRDCWEWMGTKNGKGYGVVRHDGKTWMAHRLAFLFANAVHPEGKFVLHECDNPACINPKHLRLGTAQDNAQDQKQRGRGHWQARSKRWRSWGLTLQQRRELEQALAQEAKNAT